MKRIWITLLAVAVALTIALPAGAAKPDFCDPESLDYREGGHPSCPTGDPEPPPPADDDVVICAFDLNGVLVYPDLLDVEGEPVPIALGGENTSHRCMLTADPLDSFDFEIGTIDGATTLLQPMVAVTDAYPSGDMCFRGFETGRTEAAGGVFATFSMGGIPLDGDEDGECDFAGTDFHADGETDIYTLTFQTGKAKGGTVQLAVTPAPMQSS